MNFAEVINSLSGEQVFCCGIFLTMLYMLVSLPAVITELIFGILAKRKEKLKDEKPN